MSIKVRIRFSKTGSMKFLGHLDVMHFFQQLMRRSNIPICYSEGFSPHQKMSFALPLSTGLESYGEYLDIETERSIPSKQALFMLNSNSVEGISILSYRELKEKAKNAMASVALADYSIRFREGYEADFDLKKKLDELLNEDEIRVLKKTKKSEKELDIKPFIHKYQCLEDENGYLIRLRLSCGSVDNTKPELLLKALYDKEKKDLDKYALMITREQIYTIEDGNIVSLEDMGLETE
ncbi:MAG: TIGR03936 family radical SAM-associated protein [Lachnospiraceae bacterium]|nr:TIGR03936 family radical SAM-associated protein [Lachnospiraceae bacterium]